MRFPHAARAIKRLRPALEISFPLLLLIVMSGCLPSGCHHSQPEALFPADSVSRRIAGNAPVDSLRRIWTTSGTKAHSLEHPRTVQFGPGGRLLYVSDLERGSIFVFDASGTFQQEIQPDAFAYPYVAGWRGDTLVAYDPQSRRLDFVTKAEIKRSVSVTDPGLSDDALTYATVADSALYVKVIGEQTPNYVARVGADGSLRARRQLPDPYWRYAGLLRAWGDSLLSLSGYRPVVDVLPLNGRHDSLQAMRLRGFDSPMLARSRAYVKGDVDQPPLLSASATPAGNRLFVLNMRPARLRVDVYGRRGRLRRVLKSPRRTDAETAFPMDLAVRRTPAGYALVVAAARPSARLAMYRWKAGAPQDRKHLSATQ